MARKNSEEYNWLDDPFNDKKIAQEQMQGKTSATTKALMGCGVVFIVILIFVLLSIGGIGALSILSLS